MRIHQFEDKGLAHYAYAVLSECDRQVILIDPARSPQRYYDYAQQHHAQIIGVIETHPHADFVSGHLEIHRKTGATLYVSKRVEADYPHQGLDEGDVLTFGKITLKAINTPGHSPDSISIVLEHQGKDKAVFTGDTLFIGDVGRPDLRENAGRLRGKREVLARHMYHSTRDKLMKLADDVIVYPAHGSGSLCGKALSDASQSTIGQEKMSNPALQDMSEDAFVAMLLQDQPFTPKYFGYDVDLNKQGAPDVKPSIDSVPMLPEGTVPEQGALIIDSRPKGMFKQGHLKGAINLQNGDKFETWLGSIVGPEETCYLLADSEQQLHELIAKAAKIGYETKIKGAMVYKQQGEQTTPATDLDYFKEHQSAFTVVDIRNAPEVKSEPKFGHALNIPLPELRERASEIPADKPVMVHCAGGYRSAAGSSIIQSALPHTKVYDLSEAIMQFGK